jgi:hypothetical protein
VEDDLKALFLAEGHTEEEWIQAQADSKAEIARVNQMLEMYGYQDGDPLMHLHGGIAAEMDLFQLFDWLDGQPLGRPCYIVNEDDNGTVKVYRMLLPRVKLKDGFIV